MSSAPAKIHILGAGTAGLAAAYYARQKFPRTAIAVYEAAGHPGGRCCSFYDPILQTEIDNAAHVILGANRRVRFFWKNPVFHQQTAFYDLQKACLDYRLWPHLSQIGLSIFNTPWADVPLNSKLRAGAALFPFLPTQTAVAYSQGDLQARLISPLCQFHGEIVFNCPLRAVESWGNKITRLIFNRREIDIKPREVIISALDDRNYRRLFGGPAFDHHRIINVVFRTSMALTLPDKRPFLGLTGGLAEWIFTSDNFLSITLSNAGKIIMSDDELARQLWQEVSAVRGSQAAFLPTYRVLDYPYATISQDRKNNNLRPRSAYSPYSNLRLSGDWTMRNYPCCLDGAILSAIRAVRSL